MIIFLISLYLFAVSAGVREIRCQSDRTRKIKILQKQKEKYLCIVEGVKGWLTLFWA